MIQTEDTLIVLVIISFVYYGWVRHKGLTYSTIQKPYNRVVELSRIVSIALYAAVLGLSVLLCWKSCIILAFVGFIISLRTYHYEKDSINKQDKLSRDKSV